MVGSDLPGEKRHPAHARRHGVTRATEKRLAELGRQLPPPSEADRKVMAADRAAHHATSRRGLRGRARHCPGGRGGGAMASASVPARLGSAGNADSPARARSSVAVARDRRGSVGRARCRRPRARFEIPNRHQIAALAGVLTAYVVLKDHPISTGGDSGPTISVTSQTLSAYQAGTAAGQPEVTVAAGETVTELNALEGLLIDSGNDMATLLADWDAGSTSAFVTKMDLTALSLGLNHTHITDPSGADRARSAPERPHPPRRGGHADLGLQSDCLAR